MIFFFFCYRYSSGSMVVFISRKIQFCCLRSLLYMCWIGQANLRDEGDNKVGHGSAHPVAPPDGHIATAWHGVLGDSHGFLKRSQQVRNDEGIRMTWCGHRSSWLDEQGNGVCRLFIEYLGRKKMQFSNQKVPTRFLHVP